jgi:hypothetical protein
MFEQIALGRFVRVRIPLYIYIVIRTCINKRVSILSSLSLSLCLYICIYIYKYTYIYAYIY